MYKHLKINLLLLLCLLAGTTLSAQYSQSGGLLTIDDGSSLFHQESSVGAQSGGRHYATSHHYVYYNGTGCWRKLRYFNGLGNLIAESDPYSHDHNGGTKILFDPKNDDVVFALFQERNSTSSSSPVWKTYIRRMELQGTTVVQGPRIEVFPHNNSVDMEVVVNQGITDLIVTGVNDDGSIQTKVYREFYNTWLGGYVIIHATTYNVAGPGTAYLNSSGAAGLWSLDTDMKGNQLVIGYNTGTYNYQSPFASNLKIHRYQYTAFGAVLTQTGSFQIPCPRLYTKTAISGSRVHQAIGLRPNGEILFLEQSGGTSFNVKKFESGNVPILHTLGSGTGDANLVVGTDGKAFVARKPSSFRIDLYDENDYLAHTYVPSWQLSSNSSQFNHGVNHLSMLDCQLLATGDYNADDQYHEFFSCTDCQGGNPTAAMEFVDPYSTISMNSYYGPQPVATYCSLNKVVVDASGTTCETGFFLAIHEFDLASWNSVQTLYSGWVPGYTTAPHNLKIADYIPAGTPMPTSKVYMVTIAVGSPWKYVNKFFKLRLCKLKYDIVRSGKSGGAGEMEFGEEQWTGKIIPNPNAGEFKLELMGAEPNEVTATILNSQGQVVREAQPLNTNMTEVALDLPAGLYFVRLQKEAQQQTLKFYIQ